MKRVTDDWRELRKYFEITHTYPLAAAEALSTLHPSSLFTFVLVSGEGATADPGFMTAQYGRVKGQIESTLLEFASKKPMFTVYNVRPGGVDWTTHTAIHKYIPQQALYKRVLVPPLNVVWNSGMIKTEGLGKVLTELAMREGGKLEGAGVEADGWLLRNGGIKRMSGL